MNEPTINYSLLGKNIKECRLRRNFTYKDLYKMSHVKEKNFKKYRKWELQNITSEFN